MKAYVIAMECEAEAVRPSMKPGEKLYVSGIGKVNAAMTAQKAIDEGADEIVNAGLSGGFGADMEIGGVYEVVSAVEYDFDLAKLNGTRIGQLDERESPFIPMTVEGRFPGRILATGDHFNDSDADYALISDELGASLRDMEGAAIAHVCERNGVKCRAYKCVTNIAGRGLMTGQYEENKRRALECLKNALISLK